MLMIICSSLLIITVIAFSIIFIKLSGLFWSGIKNSQSKIIIVPIGGHVDDIEVFIRGLINRTYVNKYGLVENIIIADMGADKETISICQKLHDEYDFIYICDAEEISNKMKEKLYI